MPSIAVLNMQGKEVGQQELSEAVFGIEPNVSVMNDMVKNYLANQRQGTQSALTRSEVSGGGKKPWRQKGTGRARQGSTRAPQWTHGGIVFAPKPREYRYTLNKKVRRLAMKSALSSKVRDNEMIVIDQITADSYKTKTIADMLKAVGSEKKALIVLSTMDEKVIASARNIPGVKTAQVNTLNVYDILGADKFIVVKDAVAKVSGGGKKPWRQKGTGRARQGSTRAPQWTHGGIVFAPKPREYRYTLNKKVRRLAMKSALSSKVRDNEMIVIDQITADSYKTKTIADMLKAVGSEKKALIVLSTMDEKVIASARNIPGVKTAQVNTLNVYDILGADKFIVVKDAVAKIEEVYA